MNDQERLPPVLAQFGRDLALAVQRDIDVEREIEARERRRRWPRRRRMAALFATGAVACAAVGAGASGLLSGNDAPPVPAERAPQRDAPGAPADPGVVVSSATADPNGGLPWAVKVFTNAAGLDCATVGRLRDGSLGTIDNGTFRKLPDGGSGATCGNLADEPLIAATQVMPGGDTRTVVFGLARDRRPVTVTIGGRVVRLETHGQGTFLLVVRGQPEVTDVHTTTADGRVVRPGGA